MSCVPRYSLKRRRVTSLGPWRTCGEDKEVGLGFMSLDERRVKPLGPGWTCGKDWG